MTGKITLEGRELKIKNIDISKLCKNPSIVMVAKRGSGKSWVIRSLLKEFDRQGMPGGVIISKTERLSPFYGKFYPDLFIHDEYNVDIIEKLLYRQRLMKKKKKQKKKIGKKIDPRCFLVMDDCMSEKSKWNKEQTTFEVLFNGRHYEITYILTLQDPMGIPPDIRGNIDYAFLLASDNETNMRKLHQHYAGMFPNYYAFKSVFEQLTSDFGCMVIANRGPRVDFTDKVLRYKAKKEDNKIIGSKQLIKFHKLNYDKHWEEKKDKLNLVDLMAKRKDAKPIKIRYVN